MRIKLKLLLVCLLLLLGTSGPLHAQLLSIVPGPLGLDSSLRLEYLVGTQSLRSIDAGISPVHGFLTQFDPQLAVVSGAMEWSPFAVASARFAGAISIVEPDMCATRQRPGGTATELDWQTHPEYGYWEVAGLYHLHSGGGYRFSVTAGYRQETWNYVGSLDAGGGDLTDRHTSRIPLIGLQTAMFFPWWKARFEVLGSPFMSRSVSLFMRPDSTAYEQRVELSSGGLIEFQCEGTVNVRPYCWLGLSGRFHYEELYGNSSGGTSPPVSWNYGDRFYARESFASIGLNFNLVY